MATRFLKNSSYREIDWKDETAIINQRKKGLYRLQFENINPSSPPIIKAGSVVDVAGSVAYFDTDTVAGEPLPPLNTTYYYYVFDTGITVGVELMQEVPIFKSNLVGWYDSTGTRRAIAKVKYIDGLWVEFDIINGFEIPVNRTTESLLRQFTYSNVVSIPQNYTAEPLFGKMITIESSYLGLTYPIAIIPQGATSSSSPILANEVGSIYFGAFGTISAGSFIAPSPTSTSQRKAWSGCAYSPDLDRLVFVANGGTTAGNRSCYIDSPNPSGGIVTFASTPVDNSWNDVAYGANLYVAVSSNGTNRVMTSPDGITWTLRPSIDTIAWQRVRYLNGLFIATGSSGASGTGIMTSPDGINWTERSSGLVNQTINGVTYNPDDKLYIATSTTKLLASKDTITWDIIPDPLSVDDSNYTLVCNDIVYNNGVYIAGATNNTAIISRDGFNWMRFSIPVSSGLTAWTSVTAVGNQILMVSRSATGNSNRACASVYVGV